jgi:hypothetical protein
VLDESAKSSQSRPLPECRDGGTFLQGYDAQNVTHEGGLVIATRPTSDTTDCGWYEPMITAAVATVAMMATHPPAPGSG